MSNMYVNFPNTNPIIFRREGDYDHIDDAQRIQEKARFFQQFAQTDRIAFQFTWRGKTPYVISLSVVVNEKSYFLHNYLDMDIDKSMSGGDYPSHFWQKYDSTTGKYFFGLPLKDIKDSSRNSIINDGDCFYFKLEIAVLGSLRQTFTSNEMICSNDIENTKLIHYNNKYPDYSFGTDFTFNPQGYDLRVPCVFLPVEQKANSEMFQTYEALTEIVDATPYETIQLQIGAENGIGMPDWFVRNLNTIFYLDDKYIDGVAYELEEGTSVEVEHTTMYNNRFVTVELVRKEPQLWREIGKGAPSADVIVEYGDAKAPSIGTESGSGQASSKIQSTGTLSVLTTESFYIKGIGNSFLDYTFSASAAQGNTALAFATPINTTNEIIYTPVNIISRATNEILETVVLENKPIASGLCNWEICNTFVIRC